MGICFFCSEAGVRIMEILQLLKLFYYSLVYKSCGRSWPGIVARGWSEPNSCKLPGSICCCKLSPKNESNSAQSDLILLEQPCFEDEITFFGLYASHIQLFIKYDHKEYDSSPIFWCFITTWLYIEPCLVDHRRWLAVSRSDMIGGGPSR